MLEKYTVYLNGNEYTCSAEVVQQKINEAVSNMNICINWTNSYSRSIVEDNVEIFQLSDTFYQYTNYNNGTIVAGDKDYILQICDDERKMHVFQKFFNDPVVIPGAVCDHDYREQGFMKSYVACIKCNMEKL